MSKVEPFSIVAAILALIGFLFGGIIGTLILIVGAVFLSLSYKRFKKDSSYGSKWILYVALGIIGLAILLRIVGIAFVAIF